VAVSGDYAYVADGHDGLYILQNKLITGISDNKLTRLVTFLLGT